MLFIDGFIVLNVLIFTTLIVILNQTRKEVFILIYNNCTSSVNAPQTLPLSYAAEALPPVKSR